MGGACALHGEDVKSIQSFNWCTVPVADGGSPKPRWVEDVKRDNKIIGLRVRTGFNWLRRGPCAGLL
jgi:hypothetical protein